MSDVRTYASSGAFKNTAGQCLLKSIDDAVLFGKQDPKLNTYIEYVYREYKSQLKHTQIKTNVAPSVNELFKTLHFRYKQFSEADRYILIMDSLRDVFSKHDALMDKKLKTPDRTDRNSSKKDTCDSSRRILRRREQCRAKTVISETTSVTSKFSQTSSRLSHSIF